MNTTELLLKAAAHIRASSPELVAVGHLKAAGYSEDQAKGLIFQESMEKAAFVALSNKGFDPEEAAKLVKAANIDVKALAGVSLDSYEEEVASLLEKAAKDLAKLEGRVQELSSSEAALQKQAGEHEQTIALPDSVSRLATSGAFTYDDLQALQSLNSDVLTKVAAAIDEPWGMGKAVGVARAVTDPLFDFLCDRV